MLFQSQFAMALTYAPPIIYRSKSVHASGNVTSVTKPAGVAVGDLALIFQPQLNTTQGVTTASGATWGRINLDFGVDAPGLVWKVLDATDVANAWNFAAGVNSYQCLAWQGNGATTLTLKETTDTTGTTLPYIGFNPAGAHKGAIAILGDRTSTDTPVQPANWSLRDSGAYGNGPTIGSALADNLGGYLGGAATWTNLTANAATGWLLEVT